MHKQFHMRQWLRRQQNMSVFLKANQGQSRKGHCSKTLRHDTSFSIWKLPFHVCVCVCVCVHRRICCATATTCHSLDAFGPRVFLLLSSFLRWSDSEPLLVCSLFSRFSLHFFACLWWASPEIHEASARRTETSRNKLEGRVSWCGFCFLSLRAGGGWCLCRLLTCTRDKQPHTHSHHFSLPFLLAPNFLCVLRVHCVVCVFWLDDVCRKGTAAAFSPPKRRLVFILLLLFFFFFIDVCTLIIS